MNILECSAHFESSDRTDVLRSRVVDVSIANFSFVFLKRLVFCQVQLFNVLNTIKSWVRRTTKTYIVIRLGVQVRSVTFSPLMWSKFSESSNFDLSSKNSITLSFLYNLQKHMPYDIRVKLIIES